MNKYFNRNTIEILVSVSDRGERIPYHNKIKLYKSEYT